MLCNAHTSSLLTVEERKRSMKKSIKTVLLSLALVGTLAGCDFGQNSTSSVTQSSNSDTSLTSSSSSSESSSSSSSSSESSSVVTKTDIVLTADKTNLDVNESVTITSNVEGVTYSTVEGASVNAGVFSATKEGTFVVTAHKDGDYNDGTITFTVTFAKTANKVKAILKTMKEGQNFTVTANNLLGVNKIYRTENYFFDAQSNEGQALFTNIIPNTQFDKVAHYIKLVNNELIIGNDIVYQNSNGEGVIATDLYDTDGLHYVDVDALKFEGNNGIFYTADNNTIVSMSAILGSEYVLYADKIEFSFDKDFDLNARVIYINPDTNQFDEESINAFGYIKFSDIGKTVAPVVDEAIKNVTVSETGMSEEVASSFMLTKAHLKATIKQFVGETVTVLGTSEYHFDEKYLIEDKVVRGTTIHNFYEKDESGNANYVGIGPDNKLVRTNYGEWDSFTFPFATLTLSDFRQTTAHTYSYMGYSSNAVAKYLAWANIGDNVLAYITAKEENGKIASFTCETANQLNNIGTDDAPVYKYGKYVFEIEVLPYETIVAPAPFEADADTTRVKAYMDELTESGANYTLMIGDHYSPSDLITIKVTEKTILIKNYKNSQTTYKGYHVLDDGVIEFSASDNNGEASAKLIGDVEMAEGQTLASLLGLNIAPETLKFDEDGNIIFKDGVLNGGKGLFNDFYWKDYAMDGTIKFIIYGDHISSINFKYADGSTTAQYAQLFMFGTTGLTSNFEKDLVAKLATIKDAPHPTSWAEESPAAYEKMVTLCGEELAAIIPYIYDETVSGFFDGGTLSSSTTLRIKLTDNKTLSDAYRSALTQACVDAGFTKASNISAKLTVGNKILTVGTLASQVSIIYKNA